MRSQRSAKEVDSLTEGCGAAYRSTMSPWQARNLPTGWLARGRGRRSTLNERLIGAVPGCGKRQSGQGREGLRACLLHDRSAVVLDGALADAEIRSDILAGMAGENQIHDLM